MSSLLFLIFLQVNSLSSSKKINDLEKKFNAEQCDFKINKNSDFYVNLLIRSKDDMGIAYPTPSHKGGDYDIHPTIN